MPGPGSQACPKPEPRQRTKARKDRQTAAHVRQVRAVVFHEHANRCVVCGWPADSLHEIRPSSVVGSRVIATTVDNSVPVCGSGTTKCHGLLQQHLVRAMEVKGQRRFVVSLSALNHPEVKELAARIAWHTRQDPERER